MSISVIIIITLIAREDFIKFTRRESTKTYKIKFGFQPL
jgi:hypothetical protein